MTSDSFKGLEACVHCGFCLQDCPTYRETAAEADSPRGRIVLMRGLADGRLSPDEPGLAEYLDRCLGCRGCEPVCPSGVAYGFALEAARHLLAETRPIPFTARAINAAMADELLRTPLLFASRLFRPMASLLAGGSKFGFLLGMLAATRPWLNGTPTRKPKPRNGRSTPPATSTPPVALFTGCVMSGLFSHVNAATERTLAANGYSIAKVPRQTCCGALHLHAGQRDRALELARRNVEAFASVPDALIAVNSAGCGATLKEYGTLLAGDPLEDQALAFARRVRDVTELLAEPGPRIGGRLRLRVAYDPPCHLLHAQGVAAEPIAVLDAIPGLERVAHADAELCCGSAGSYSFTQSELSRAVLDRKVRSLLAAAPDVVATGNPGCIMQIGAGLAAAGSKVPVVHPVEILDRSYARAGYYD